MHPQTPPHRRPIHEEDGETFESLPWESLTSPGVGGDPRRWYIVAALIVAAGLGVSVIRTMTVPPPVDIVAATTMPTPPPAPPTTPVASVVTEADLMAVDPTSLDRAAAAVAELAVTEFFSDEREGIWAGAWSDAIPGPGKATFVEQARAVAVESLGPARFVVTVAVSLLTAGDDGAFVRGPLRGVQLVVDGTGGGFRPLDLPSPVVLDLGWFTPPAALEALPDPAFVAAAGEWLAPHGVASPEPVSYGVLASGNVRMVLLVTDPAGTAWPLAVVLDQNRNVVPPG